MAHETAYTLKVQVDSKRIVNCVCNQHQQAYRNVAGWGPRPLCGQTDHQAAQAVAIAPVLLLLLLL